MTFRHCNKTLNQGFTLLEVLVALVIIAISLGAIMSTSGNQAHQTGYLKYKTLANWVAMNEMTKLQLDEQWPSVGEKTGTANMANVEWFWLRTVKKTQDKDARQIEFQVFSDNNHSQQLSRLIGFINK